MSHVKTKVHKRWCNFSTCISRMQQRVGSTLLLRVVHNK